MPNEHSWRFFQTGGVDQVVLDRGADIRNLASLDLKLWVAVAMPTKGTELDAKTARFLDTDSDDRIRAPDILAAIAWLDERLESFDPLLAAEPAARAELSNLKHPQLRETATRISEEAGSDGKSVTLDHVLEAEKKFDEGALNGDGIVTPKSTADETLSKLVEDVLATHGGVEDRSKAQGVDATRIEAFFADVEKLAAWRREGTTPEVEKPVGDATEKAAELLRTLTPKLDDYFTRCRLAAFDERASAAAHGTEADLAALASRDLAAKSAELLRLPIARIAPGQALPFEGQVNPGFVDELLRLRDEVVRPLLGASVSALSEPDFRKLQQRFASYEAWRAKKPETKVDALSTDRLEELLAGDHRKRLEDLVAKDKDLESERERLVDVEKLLLFHRDLVKVLRSFVNFSDFYGKKGALFQTGTLYLDGRSCALCIEVPDVGRHATLASMASTYLAYCELRRKGEPNRTIVAAFTAGEADNLMVGRNGVFVDRKGRDWDANITRVVENPISIRQAFWSPYKKFVRLVEEQIARRATEADAQAQARVTSAAEATANADRAATEPAAAAAAGAAGAAPRRTFDVGTIAALGVAVGGIGAMVTGLVGAFFGLGLFMPLGVLAIVLMISGPSMLLAYLKLRRRNLGPLLDASGWAVNGFANVNVPFGGALTAVATLPRGASRSLHDPYAEKKSPIKTYVTIGVLLLLGIAWTMGKLDPYLPRGARASHVLHRAQTAEPAAQGAPSATP